MKCCTLDGPWRIRNACTENALKRQAAEQTGDTDLHRRELASVECKISNATAAILDSGLDRSDALAEALKDLESQTVVPLRPRTPLD